MTRPTRLPHLRLLGALACAGALFGIAIAACGSRSPAPTEVPPMAPQPDRATPAEPMPSERVVDAGALTPGVPVRPGPVSMAKLPVPEFAAAQPAEPIGPPLPDPQPMPASPEPNGSPMVDAAVDDSGMPALPPLPDAKIPVDGGM